MTAIYARLDPSGTAMAETAGCDRHRLPGSVACTGNDALACVTCGSGDGLLTLVDEGDNRWVELATDRWWAIPDPADPIPSSVGPDEVWPPGRSRESVERDHEVHEERLTLTPPAPTVEVLDGRAAAALPPGSWVIQSDEDGTPLFGTRPIGPPEAIQPLLASYRVLYRAPAPVGLGDELVLPRHFDWPAVGTVIRLGRTYALAIRGVNGWTADRCATTPEDLLVLASAPGYGPWRVIDLPAPTTPGAPADTSQETPA